MYIAQYTRRFRRELVLQRRFTVVRSVAAASVVAGAGLVLATASPDRPAQYGLDTGRGSEDEGGEQVADLVG